MPVLHPIQQTACRLEDLRRRPRWPIGLRVRQVNDCDQVVVNQDHDVVRARCQPDHLTGPLMKHVPSGKLALQFGGECEGQCMLVGGVATQVTP